MVLKRHLLSAFIVGLVSLFGFSCMAILVSTDKIDRFDSMLITFIQGSETPALTAIMKFFTFIGSFPVVLVLFLIVSFVLYAVRNNWAEVFLFGIGILGAPVINHFLKLWFQRARPDAHMLIDIGGYSFPSGHAMSAFAVYGMLAFILWQHIPNRLGRTAIIIISSVFILMIGTSRIYLGVHYPSDIIGGYFASSVWLTVVIWPFQRYKEKQYERREVVE